MAVANFSNECLYPWLKWIRVFSNFGAIKMSSPWSWILEDLAKFKGRHEKKNPSCVYVLHKTSHKEISSCSDAVGSLRGNLLTGCYVCLSRCTIEISRSSRAAGSPLWSVIMSVMSRKKERRIINLQYQNGNILTERVTDVFLRSQKSGLNYVAGVNNRWAVLSLLLLA